MELNIDAGALLDVATHFLHLLRQRDKMIGLFLRTMQAGQFNGAQLNSAPGIPNLLDGELVNANPVMGECGQIGPIQ